MELADHLQDSLEKLMPGRYGEVAPFLGRMLGAPLPHEASQWLDRMEGEALKWQTFRALREFLSSLTDRGPVVLVFENLHWTDLASMELLEQMLQLVEEMSLLIVWVYRPEPDRLSWRLREVASREHRATYTELWLRPIPSAAAEQMIGQLLETDRVPREVLDLVIRRSEGNPLFIEEIVRSMVEREILVQGRGGQWRLSSKWTEISIPDTLQGILQSRIDQLDAESKRVLQIAACIGRLFSREMLSAVAEKVGVPSDRFDRCLKALEEAALVQRKEGTAGEEFAFRHVLLRDTVHNNLLRDTRSQFHAAVAEWYEEHRLQEPEPPYSIVAYHYEHTDHYEKQRLYSSKAGYQAMRNYANEEASRFFSKALSLAADPDNRIELLFVREKVYDLMGKRIQQRADLEELLRLVDQSGDDVQKASVHNRLAYWYASQGDYPAATAEARKGSEVAQRAGDLRAEGESLQSIASTAWRQGQFTEALEAAWAALETARSVDDAVAEADSLTTVGVIHRSVGEPMAARTHYQDAIRVRRAIGDQRGEAINLTQLGNIFCDEGEYSAAFDHHQQALELFRMVGERRSEAWSLGGLGTVYLRCGDYEAARACCEEALALRRAVDDRRGEAVALGDLGSVLLATGDLEGAQAYLEQALVLVRSVGARRDEVHILTYLGRVLEEVGNLDGAQVAHQHAFSLRREQGQRVASIENVAGLARLALKRGDLEMAREYVEEILAFRCDQDLARIESPFLVCLTGIRILQATGEDKLAQQMLETVYPLVMERARKITDPKLKRSFLERIPENQEILSLWQQRE
jgi:tetratricopeptide (TPR) repeat protein